MKMIKPLFFFASKRTVNRKAEKGVAAEKVFQRSNTATYSTFKFTDRFDSHRKDETSSQVKCQQRKFQERTIRAVIADEKGFQLGRI